MDWQIVGVWSVVILSVMILLRRIGRQWRAGRRGGSGCHGCSGCSTSSAAGSQLPPSVTLVQLGRSKQVAP